jgi:CRISPR/Cas system-associated exonuclease Cas4 (RecB family)
MSSRTDYQDGMTLDEQVKAIIARASTLDRRPARNSFSNATECIRALVYDRIDWAPAVTMPARWSASAILGTALGDWLEQAAVELGIGKAQVPVTLTMDGTTAEGTADLVTEDHVIDFKRVEDAGWSFIKAKPKFSHRVQVNAYAVALGKPRWALIYIRGVGKGEDLPYLIHEGLADEALARTYVIEAWQEVAKWVERGKLPARPFTEQSFECRVCAYHAKCWERK